MKTLGTIGMALGVLSGLMGLYLQFVLIPASDVAESNWNVAISSNNDAYFNSLQHRNDLEIMGFADDFGAVLLFSGLLAFLLSIFPAIKQQRVAWIGVVLGIACFFLGAAYGTHMFA